MSQKIKVAIIGSGNIGTDLMIKILRHGQFLEMGAMVGIDPASDGLARAEAFGVPTTDGGIEGLLSMDNIDAIKIAFDATSAGAHKLHSELLKARGIKVIDLTPAAIGPYVIPAINLDEHLDAPNINMVTCGGQATIPLVASVSRVARVHYAEIVASMSSRSAGPGTRANIDEFTETTSKAIEVCGGAERGKAIIILNPAEPPMLMRDSIFVLSELADEATIKASIEQMVTTVQRYVPGYRLKQQVQFEVIPTESPLNVPGIGKVSGLKTSIYLEVEGAAHYLPAYAGNLDIMTSAAKACAEHLAETRLLATTA
ncbi:MULTISPECIES: acetaldehyde dehydrogenase (acetylating) [unclassified Halomonas]|uniref:acetaldehyde dehydrogenase (acetylating) n=1 Tax=unclassified Halomonas TaxID=2609666 RepID=UPI001CF5BC3F|nr:MULTISPECIES: acetaldehyde dehydrogenase (acetylating) [unclassified Halomonas]MCA8864356.1 acetaldehyde dehydrogenase (acetylating) [Halomonas sp. SBBP1]UZH10030.1 acetaldehyde dehydrogenase (acetylating) [Halomonas sp. BDJS001]